MPDNIADLTAKAVKNNKTDADKVADIIGQNGDKIYASASGEYFPIKPCSMKQIPILVGLLTKLDEEFAKFNGDSNSAIVSSESKVLELMAEVIKMGIGKDNPDITTDVIQEKFCINDFPVAYQKVLDTNDFLSQMRKITQVR